MNYAHRYEGRRALVTGGGSGIGQATVLRLLAEGGSVVAADVSEPGLKDTVEKAGAHAERLTTLVVDIADETSVREGVRAATEALGGLDVLVNAAGILRSSHTGQTSLADFTRRASDPRPKPAGLVHQCAEDVEDDDLDAEDPTSHARPHSFFRALAPARHHVTTSTGDDGTHLADPCRHRSRW